MTKCEENIKAKLENELGVQLGPYEKCLEMSDKLPEKFKAECKTISERFLDNMVKGKCKEAEEFFFNDQDLCEKYVKNAFTCDTIMRAKGVSGMGVLICVPIVRYKMAADFFAGEQKTYQDKINDIINDLEHMKAIVCEDSECGKKYEYVYQTLKKFKESYKEDNERLKSIIKEYEEIESTIDVPTGLMKTIHKEIQSKIKRCEADEHTGADEHIGNEYLEVGDNGKLYIKEVLHKFYPELNNSKDIVNKIEDGTYFVRQFGMDINNFNNGGRNDDPVTYTGNIDKRCLNISHSNTIIESYSIKDDGTVSCCNQILDNVKRENTTLHDKDYTHIQIVKAAKDYSNIDNTKPLVTVSQSQPLIIANVYNGKLIKKDGTVTKTTLNACKEFCDNNGSITDCTDKGEECYTCQDSMYDFQGEIPVYMI